MFTFRQNILGSTSASSATAAICVNRTGRCSIFWFLLLRCRAYKTREILSVSGVLVAGWKVHFQSVGNGRSGPEPSRFLYLVFRLPKYLSHFLALEHIENVLDR